MRMFIGLDGAHTKSKYRMQLLIAVGIDANDRTLPLTWALVPIENKEWWTWFCKNLCEAFDEVEEEGFVFISDREKGLILAVEEFFPQAVHAHYYNHIADNIAGDYGNKCKPLFQKCARAKIEEAFKTALAALSSYSSEAGRYVDNIPHYAWARYAFLRPRFGHDTSNINESINNAWLDIRRLPPLQMLDNIYATVMKTVHDRFYKPQKFEVIADVLMRKFNERLQASRRFRVFESGNGIYQVQILDTGVQHIVNLRTRHCSCIYFQDYSSPYTYAITALQHATKDPFSYFSKAYRVRTLRWTY